MIKLLNKETKTAYVLSDSTATKWLKQSPEIWCPISVGEIKGQPAKKVSDEVAQAAVAKVEKTKDEIKKEDEPEEEKPKFDVNTATYAELKAMAQRLGCVLRGQVKKETLINMINEKQGE